jgi:hypothetical protein
MIRGLRNQRKSRSISGSLEGIGRRSLTNATTGSERIVPGQESPAETRGPLLARLTRPAVVHWQFTIVAAAAIAVRILVLVAYSPILWFNDSYNYLYDAVYHIPDQVRPNGYPLFLDLLLPLHSVSPIALLQAAMGVGMGAAIYALLRHRGLPWWGAILPALPVLFDAYELHLEHMVTADPLFIFLVALAVVFLCWSDRPSVLAMAVAGLMIGYASITRSVGEPLLAVVFVAMLVRRVGWLRLVSLVVAGIMPIAGYLIWFHTWYGQYALSDSGAFLYSRVSTFALCSRIDPPAGLQFLCDTTPPSLRPVAGEYVWADNELGRDAHKTTPLYRFKNSTDVSLRFKPVISAETEQFAKDAILAQPADYLRVVFDDTLHTFGWNRQPDPNDYEGNGRAFNFEASAVAVPWWAGPPSTPQAPQWVSKYGFDVQARQMWHARQDFDGVSLGDTSVVGPLARVLQVYQRVIYLRGTLLGLVVLIGAAGVVARWRRWGGTGLLPWLVGALLIVLPPMAAGFSYRYVLAAVPVACLAAGLAFARPPGERSVGALAADLWRHLGGGSGVDQE